MSREVVLDIETQDPISNAGYDGLRISVIGVYFYETDSYEAFFEDDLPKLWTRLEHADRIIGYNTKGFDNPVINNYYPGDINNVPQLDLLEKIHGSLGYRIKLGHVAEATIGEGKSGSGLRAVELWKEGKLDELSEYCLQDVKVTKDIYDFALEHGHVKFMDRGGQLVEIPIEVGLVPTETRQSINLTMPF